MIKEAIGFGNTVDEAKEDALLRLGAREDEDVQIEIVTMPKAKILGLFGGSKAEVKAYVERPDKPAKKNNKPDKKATAPAKRAEPKKADSKKSQPKQAEEKSAKERTADKTEIQLLDRTEFATDSKVGVAIAYLDTILNNLGCENITVKAAIRNDSSAIISLEGEGLGVIIGHRGETLDALQHLVSLAASNSGGYFKVTLNIGDYREKREQTLASLATRIADQVLSTKRNRALEPMSAYERRIIHTTVQEIEGVSSASVGEGSSRRVVIFPEGSTPNMPRRDDRNRRRSGRGGRDSRPSNKVEAPVREPKSDSDVPLYGKITKL